MTENITKLDSRIKNIQKSQSLNESLLNHTFNRFKTLESLYRKSQHSLVLLDRQSLHEGYQRNNNHESRDFDHNNTPIEDCDTTLVREDDDGETIDCGFIPQMPSQPHNAPINSNSRPKTSDQMDLDNQWACCAETSRALLLDFLDADMKSPSRSFCYQTKNLSKRMNKQSMKLNSEVETVLPDFTEEEMLNLMLMLGDEEYEDSANSTILAPKRKLLDDSDDDIDSVYYNKKRKKIYASMTQ